MPDSKDDTSAAGDAEKPATNPRAPSAAEIEEIESRPGQGENQAGFLKDTDAPEGGSERS
jgi:hypothetical protein